MVIHVVPGLIRVSWPAGPSRARGRTDCGLSKSLVTPPTLTSSTSAAPSIELKDAPEFQAKSDTGQDVVLVVDSSDDKTVEVRLCHPLYKKDLSYQVEVISVTDPTPPPLPGAALVEETDDDGGKSAG